jgi:predicted porin
LRPEAQPLLPRGSDIGEFDQIVVGQDISFAWRHLQLWAEVYAARFEVPRVGDADTIAFYLEAKYKFTPAFFAALRWNQQFFGDVPNGYGRDVRWGKDVWRADAAAAYRFTAHTQLKVQYSLETAPYSSDLGHMVAVQFTVRF